MEGQAKPECRRNRPVAAGTECVENGVEELGRREDAVVADECLGLQPKNQIELAKSSADWSGYWSATDWYETYSTASPVTAWA